ncbi:APC family permease [Candidatus Sororendozoicomonas aggregata]|uniref:APC family permease n=1 Tax=Candidatus Sororendozoicomonas aggregata TaxID=3073239 RepID=UPI002ED04740
MNKGKNKKKLTYFDCLGFCTGQIIGSGIFVLTGVVIGFTGHGTPYAFIVSAFYALVVMLPSAVLASTIPASGAGFSYVKKLLGDKAGFMYLFMFVLTQLLIATFAKGFGSYFVSLFPTFNENTIAIGVLILCTAINLIGLKTSAKAQKTMVGLLIVSLLAFVIFGLPQVEWSNLAITTANIMPNGFKEFIHGAILLSFAAGGARYVAENGEEIEEPGKTIPKAMITSTLGACALYALLGIVASSVLPIEEVAFKNLTLVAQNIFPPWLYVFFVVGGAMFALLTTLNGTLSWVTRGLQAAAKEGWLPDAFAKENKGGTPVLLLGFFFIVGIVPIITGLDLKTIADMGIGFDQLCEGILIVAAFKLPKKYPEAFKNAPFTFKESTFYILLTTCIFLRFGSAYVELAELESKLYIAVAIAVYIIIAYMFTYIGYRNVTDKKLKSREIQLEENMR